MYDIHYRYYCGAEVQHTALHGYTSGGVRTEGRSRQSAMEEISSNTPVTDGEQWSDDTERSSSEIETSPQINAGYIRLDQQYLLFEDGNDDEDEGEEDVQAPVEAAETWQQSPNTEDSDDSVDGVEGGRVNQQPDVRETGRSKNAA